jgi:organic hydroperoxide reductase OsmC/OhrA
METYTVTIQRGRSSGELFVDNRYSRGHKWIFDGGIEVAASASPHVVPLPLSVKAAVDPEEAFIASIASCHMLWFLSIAAGKKIVVEQYEDRPEGILSKNEEGKTAVTKVVLRPDVRFGGGSIPSDVQVDELHRLAHGKCFIANSIRTEIIILNQK